MNSGAFNQQQHFHNSIANSFNLLPTDAQGNQTGFRLSEKSSHPNVNCDNEATEKSPQFSFKPQATFLRKQKTMFQINDSEESQNSSSQRDVCLIDGLDYKKPRISKKLKPYHIAMNKSQQENHCISEVKSKNQYQVNDNLSFKQIKKSESHSFSSKSGNKIVHQYEAALKEEQERHAFFLQKKKTRRRSSLKLFFELTSNVVADQQVDIMASDDERDLLNHQKRQVNSVKDLIGDLSFGQKIAYIKKQAGRLLCGKFCTRNKRVKKNPTAKTSVSMLFEGQLTNENQNQKQEIELEYEKLLKQGIIKQDHPGRKNWDVLIICFSLYNCIELPMEIAFSWRNELDKLNITEKFNNVIDFMFFVDIVMNFRTTYFNPRTGEEIIEKHLIQKNYLFGQFIIDLFSTIPFDVLYEAIFMQNDENSAQNLQMMSMMKIIRILRLSRLINYLNTAEDLKLSLKLGQTIFLILLYIHITGCIWYYLINLQENWEPPQGLSDSLLTLSFGKQFFIIFYNAILALCGNDLLPASLTQYVVGSLFLMMGAILQATMFGQVAGIIESMSRKSQAFQEKIDIANTTMKNMHLKEDMQMQIRDFLTMTMSNLDNQKEMEEFLKILSPSMRIRVTNYIFEQAIIQNEVFSTQTEMVEFIIEFIKPKLTFPEDPIIRMGQVGDCMYFLASGECLVSVSNHLKEKITYKEELVQGSFFGEVSIIFGSLCTANVESKNYCTLARLEKEHFQKMCRLSPDMFHNLKDWALENYHDDWIQFKSLLVEQVDYINQLSGSINLRQLIREIQFNLEVKIYQKGAEILKIGDQCNSLMFIVNGMVEIHVTNQSQEKIFVEILKQGDQMCQYSVINGEELEFGATALTNVRLIQLQKRFFDDQQNEIQCGDHKIEGFFQAIELAKSIIQKHGVPVCDFKIFDYGIVNSLKRVNIVARNLNEVFKRGVDRAIAISKVNKQSQNFSLLKIMKKVVEIKQLKRRIANLKLIGKENTIEFMELDFELNKLLQFDEINQQKRFTNISRLLVPGYQQPKKVQDPIKTKQTEIMKEIELQQKESKQQSSFKQHLDEVISIAKTRSEYKLNQHKNQLNQFADELQSRHDAILDSYQRIREQDSCKQSFNANTQKYPQSRFAQIKESSQSLSNSRYGFFELKQKSSQKQIGSDWEPVHSEGQTDPSNQRNDQNIKFDKLKKVKKYKNKQKKHADRIGRQNLKKGLLRQNIKMRKMESSIQEHLKTIRGVKMALQNTQIRQFIDKIVKEGVSIGIGADHTKDNDSQRRNQIMAEAYNRLLN